MSDEAKSKALTASLDRFEADVNIKKGSLPASCLALSLKNITAVELLLENGAKND